MAERWDRDRDRGFGDRAADEVRSWFGDDDAQRRRERDEREGRYERRPYGERGWSGEPDRPRDRERWMGREDYRDRDRERSYGGGEPISRTPYAGPLYWRNDYTSTNYSGGQYAGDYGRAQTGYAGMGPRGYRRSDQRMLEDVCDRLTDDPRINASDVEVKCQDGTVTLTGTVQSRDEKRAAEDVAESVTGVRDVNNNLRVTSGAIGSPGAPNTPLGLSGPGGDARHTVNTQGEPGRRR